MAPFDVLVDPMSMPEHEVIKGKVNTHQVVHEDSAANSDGEEVRSIVYGWSPPAYVHFHKLKNQTVVLSDHDLIILKCQLRWSLRLCELKVFRCFLKIR